MDEQKESKIIWTKIWRPYKVCVEHSARSTLWAIYIIFGGLLGVVINLINRCIFGDMSFQEVLYIESTGGTFYTYSIVLISAAIGPLFFNISESKILHFPEIKTFAITICIFVMVFCAIFYSNTTGELTIQKNQLKELNFSLDWYQFIFFIISIFLAFYSLGIEYLDMDPARHKDIDSSAEYLEKEEKQVEKLEKANPEITQEGVKL